MAHLTVTDVSPRESYTVGGTPLTAFLVPFPFFDLTDLSVYVDGEALTYDATPADATEFSVAGTAVDGGYQSGTVTIGGSGVSNASVVIVRAIPAVRASDFPYPAATLNIKTLNTELDRAFAILQQLQTQIARTVRLADSEAAQGLELPEAADRANHTLGFGADGSFELYDLESGVTEAGNVNFLQAGAGAGSQTVQYFLRTQHVDAGAWLVNSDGTGAGNRAAINGAVAAAQGRELKIPQDSFAMSGAVDVSGVAAVLANGALFDHSADTAGTYTEGGCLVAKGSGPTSLGAITGAVSKGATAVAVASAPALSAGDIVILAEPSTAWNAAQSHYRKGEFGVVKSVVSLTVNLEDGLIDGYSTSAILYKVGTVTPRIHDLSVKGLPSGHANANTTASIMLQFAALAQLDKVKGYGSRYGAILWDRCFDGLDFDCETIQDVSGSGYEYGTVVSNSQALRFLGGRDRGMRHPFTAGGANVTGAVVNRFIGVRDRLLRGNGASPPFAADLHGNCEFSGFENCQIFGGVQMGGDRNHLRRNVIFPEAATLFYLADALGPNFEFAGNQWHARFFSASNALLEMANGLSANTTRSGRFTLLNERFVYDRDPTANHTLARFRNAGSTAALGALIVDPVIDVSQVSSWASGASSKGFAFDKTSGSNWGDVKVKGFDAEKLNVTIEDTDRPVVESYDSRNALKEGLYISAASAEEIVVRKARTRLAGTSGMVIQGESGAKAAKIVLDEVNPEESNNSASSGSSAYDGNLIVNFATRVEVRNSRWGGTKASQAHAALIGDASSGVDAVVCEACADFGDDRTTIYAAEQEVRGFVAKAASTLQLRSATNLHFTDPTLANGWQGISVTNLKKFRRSFQVSFATGATSRAFAHNLDGGSLTASNCQALHWHVAVRGSPGSARSWWVSAVDATNVTIDVDTNPGATVLFEVTAFADP